MNATARVPTVTASRAAAPAPTAPGIGEPPCEWGLPHRPESAGTARRITQAVLDAWDTDNDATDQALLVVSELVTNAIEHALPPVVLRLAQRTDTLHIEVDDGGPAPQKVPGALTATRRNTAAAVKSSPSWRLHAAPEPSRVAPRTGRTFPPPTGLD